MQGLRKIEVMDFISQRIMLDVHSHRLVVSILWTISAFLSFGLVLVLALQWLVLSLSFRSMLTQLV